MSSDKPTLATPTKVLFLFTFFIQFISAFYSAWQTELPPVFQLLYWIAFGWLMWWWLREDSKRTGDTWPMDLGYFLFIAWYIIIPYHLFATRGVKGFIGILSFIGVFLAGWLAAVIVIILVWY